MRLGYAIIYVADVLETVAFYERAFRLKRRFVHDSHLYAEMETGETILAVAGEPMAEQNGFAIKPNRPADQPAGFELALVTDDPAADYAAAIEAGAIEVSAPTTKPWGQTVGYVRDLNGCLIELCSPMGG